MEKENTSTATAKKSAKRTVQNKAVHQPVASSVILLFCLTGQEELHSVEKVVKQVQRDFEQVRTVVFLSGKTQEDIPFGNLVVITKKEINLLGGLKNRVRKQLKMPAAPLMIVFPGNTSKPCKKIIRTLSARIKAGAREDTACELLDFRLKDDSTEKRDYETFYKQLIHYVRLTGILENKHN